MKGILKRAEDSLIGLQENIATGNLEAAGFECVPADPDIWLCIGMGEHESAGKRIKWWVGTDAQLCEELPKGYDAHMVGAPWLPVCAKLHTPPNVCPIVPPSRLPQSVSGAGGGRELGPVKVDLPGVRVSVQSVRREARPRRRYWREYRSCHVARRQAR